MPDRGRWAITLLLVLPWLGCNRRTKADAGETCSSEEDGGSGGCKKGLWCFHGDDRDPRCLTREEADAACRKTKKCTVGGGCTYHVGIANCVASTDAECAQSETCRERGRCTHHRNACVVKTDADCKRARVCEEDGRCTAKTDAVAGKCVASPP